MSVLCRNSILTVWLVCRWNYHRMCVLILFSFYKNIAYVLCQLWFALLNKESGQTLFDSVYGAQSCVYGGFFLCFWRAFFVFGAWVTVDGIGMVYNLMFAGSLPIILFAIFEQDVGEQENLSFPVLYIRGQQSKDFNNVVFSRLPPCVLINAHMALLSCLFQMDCTVGLAFVYRVFCPHVHLLLWSGC